jgi:hypothetical protein
MILGCANLSNSFFWIFAIGTKEHILTPGAPNVFGIALFFCIVFSDAIPKGRLPSDGSFLTDVLLPLSFLPPSRNLHSGAAHAIIVKEKKKKKGKNEKLHKRRIIKTVKAGRA